MSQTPLTYDELAAVIQECAGVAIKGEILSGQPDLTFTDLSVDSLGVLGIIAALENRYGVKLGSDVEQFERPQQLRAYVHNLIGTEAADAGAH